MNSNFEKLKIEIYGESHAPEVGVKISGIPKETQLTLSCVKNLLDRRKSMGGLWATPRREKDEPEILSGLEKKTKDGEEIYEVTSNHIEIVVKNENIKAKDYATTQTVPRPSHADYVSYVKDGRSSTGGGRFSGRLTVPFCIAGGIAQELLESCGIKVCAYISSIGGAYGASYKDDNDIATNGINPKTEKRIKKSAFPLLDESDREKMQECIREAAYEGDSVGGTIDCIVTGLETGMLGDALFEGLEGKLAYALYAIPAVRGVEFGAGFSIADMTGIQANDFFVKKGGRIATETNNSGGINGGISNGMPLTMRVAFRPTPSISRDQRSVDLNTMTEVVLNVKGRHDACIVPRAVPCVEAAVSIALLDEVLKLRERVVLYQRLK